ncbi:Methionyl-tRNA formyltransferase [Gemella morbillorum]|uniref:methionyl-tRNA formyltransferase n=1 Tax=Gemella morbillorum TaxID=29391 RepID=UPI000DA386CD|nr:methionyl-tRNA formyltransferase [Gemella morbillorum]MDK8240006.1 methionyl-tRNA formyltransferase [Gemella morbillorum]MDK8255468.1 methionyl-tRNA formyltransferase [Gemella morbillorum]UBH80063.1 methionyl-tRNA formyltransferase [Gemella morbillorum]SQH55444.1 Methionyl-tRNA formyltransferase [Gemella morbillorum]
MDKKKIVFMGTPKFAVPVLEMLIEKYGVDLVITQPDKKVGRKKVLTAPPVKVIAEEKGIKVLQPEKISNDENVLSELKELNPDIIITAAYGQLVPETILEIPKYKCINVHGSLLPKLRGGAPIQYSILEDHGKTGITIMYMVKKLDAGDMISKVEVDILDSDNYESLHDKLSIAGRDLLKETLPNIFTGNIAPEKQDDSLATFARNILREDEKIDWNKSARQIFNQIRALDPTPGAFTYLDENVLKIWNSEVVDLEENFSSKKVGTIIKQDKKHIYLLCGENTVLKVKELQISGKKRMPVVNFLSNKKDYVGTILGGINE